MPSAARVPGVITGEAALLRRAVCLAGFGVLAACAGGPPPRRDFPPLRYNYLTPLRLNAASLEIVDRSPPPSGADIALPVTPVAALRQLAADRLAASGSSGSAVFVIDLASITGTRGTLNGALAVHIEMLTGEGRRAGFAEARVARRSTGNENDPRGAAYDLLRQMMDDMNVELEFQLRRSLRDWLQDTSTSAPAPAAVQQQDLGAPRL